MALRKPAIGAAQAGSTKMPAKRMMSACARRISSSVTARMKPPDSSRAAIARSQDAGLPMRIAVATVSGLEIGAPETNGAAPAAWKPAIRGRRLVLPMRTASVKPRQ